MRIQHNIAALNSYRNLTNNNSAVSKNLEKLSSGYRINRAGDDAAGLAISEKMRAQITGLNTAQKNANDGISLVQTAEGALTEVHSMLNRMVELANQSANGTYDDAVDRANLQKEIESLTDEINRISKGTNFNGINLLDGTYAPAEAATTGDPRNVKITLAPPVETGEVQGDVGGKTILHKDAPTAQDPTFTVDFNAMKISGLNSANGSNAVTFSFGDGVNVVVDLSTAAGNGATPISATDIASAVANAVNQKISDVKADTDASKFLGVKINGLVYKATASGSTVTFELSDQMSANGTTTAATTVTNEQKLTSGTDLINNLNLDITGTGSAAITGSIADGALVINEGIADKAEQLANTTFTLNAADIVDGTKLKIGNETYVFKVGAKGTADASGTGEVLVDLSKIETTDSKFLEKAMAKLTVAAANNDMFNVGSNAANQVTLQEKAGYGGNGQNGKADLTTKAGIEKQLNLVVPTSTPAREAGKALELQIGDTSDIFNRLSLHIKATDAATLGIASINIGTQQGAQDAVDRIKAAINSVSSIRGDLGAIQNRLEHTINNLSVTAENMTAAESRIRDVDMANEMMAYTKNNILVQASQAMLAQANQVPQGVLQLLQ